MNYDDAMAWLDSFHQFGMKLGLDRIEHVLHLLGDPHQKTRFIHVAGTNGKGSVCRYISRILTSEGYKTGLYLSPHLIDFRERIQLNNTYIAKERFVDIIELIRSTIEKFIQTDGQLTYFELCTIIAFVFFAEEQVDYAVIEVGLGGRYDATNVITPLVSVITTVSYDHQKQLGKTIRDIATEKAGIIKQNIPVVTGTKNTALSAIQQKSEEQGSPLTIIRKENISVHESSPTSQTLLFHGCFDDYLVTTHQIGRYQALNIGISIAVIEVLQQQGVFVTKQSILNGIFKMDHPGRMQILQKHPLVVVDGAHNPEAMRVAVESVKKIFLFDQLIVIFGVMKDKAIKAILKELIPFADIIIVTKPNVKRAASNEEISKSISKLDPSKQFIQTETVKQAYHKALEIAHDKDVIFGTGSLFTVGELLSLYTKNE